jgi:hypothetical protein
MHPSRAHVPRASLGAPRDRTTGVDDEPGRARVHFDESRAAAGGGCGPSGARAGRALLDTTSVCFARLQLMPRSSPARRDGEPMRVAATRRGCGMACAHRASSRRRGLSLAGSPPALRAAKAGDFPASVTSYVKGQLARAGEIRACSSCGAARESHSCRLLAACARPAPIDLTEAKLRSAFAFFPGRRKVFIHGARGAD